MTQTIHLVIFDADRIKDYVFATGRLKEIRGGSRLVRDASDEEVIRKKLALAEEEIVFAEGGAGVLTFSNRQRAEAKAMELENFYRKITRGATLTAIVQSGTSFREAKERGDRRLRMVKENRQAHWQTAHSPFSRACASCGARPATHTYTVSPLPEALCEWCWVKRDTSDQMSKQQPRGQRLLLNETRWGADFLAHLSDPEADRWLSAELPETTDDLAALSRPANYLGFLYADGNSMGSRLQKCQSAVDYRRFSRQVSYSLRAALWLALKTHFPGPVNDKAPFEVIALGGDDLILLCAADRVLPFAITLSKLFTRISTRLADVTAIDDNRVRQAGEWALDHLDEPVDAGDPLTLSCAAIIAHPKQPILNLEKEALQLLSRAKRAYPNQAALDFHVVSSPVLRDMRDIRRDEYQLDKETHLTARPLLLDETEKLLRHVSQIKGGGEGDALPRNKLNALYQSIFSGQEAAAFETFFLYYRLGRKQRQKLDAFFQAFGIATPPTANKQGMPWGTRHRNGANDGTFTLLADLAEIYDFIPASFDLAAQQEEERHDNPSH